jgi:hypothetical protein
MIEIYGQAALVETETIFLADKDQWKTISGKRD